MVESGVLWLEVAFYELLFFTFLFEIINKQ